jgi:hypothetical protein
MIHNAHGQGAKIPTKFYKNDWQNISGVEEGARQRCNKSRWRPKSAAEHPHLACSCSRVNNTNYWATLTVLAKAQSAWQQKKHATTAVVSGTPTIGQVNRGSRRSTTYMPSLVQRRVHIQCSRLSIKDQLMSNMHRSSRGAVSLVSQIVRKTLWITIREPTQLRTI